MTKVSVIVPIYNVEKYLEQCLQTLVNQTLKEIEIILVNDGSEDDSGTIAQKFARKYPEKLIYLEKENGGLSDARNYGVQYATGEYIGFIDSDDYVKYDMFEKMYAASDHGKMRIVECNFVWEYDKKQDADIVEGYNSLKDYMVNGRVVAWNKIYKREWLESLHVQFPKGLLYEDLNFFYKIVPFLEKIETVAVVQDRMVHYIQRKNAISYSETSRISNIIDIYTDLFDYYKEIGCYETYQDELEYKFCRNLLCAYMRKVLKVRDRRIKADLLNLFAEQIRSNFPDWKKNRYIKKHGAVNLYLKLMNPILYRLFYYITI